MKIGLTYVKGSVPGLENFGNLPTDLIKSNGLLNGNPISKELDGLIIPGGSILESKSISDDFKREIKIMAKEGKPIIGICAGYQLLSNQLDITNPNHPNLNYTIENPNLNEDNLKNGSLNKDNLKEGLGLLDVNFSYLFSNDKVESKVSSKSYLTKGLETVKGFHCHSYGGISGDGKTLFNSLLRVNYDSKFTDVVSGTINDDGNVIGTMIHNILDDNPNVVSNFFEFIGASEKDIVSIYDRNKILQYTMKNEVSIDANIQIETSLYNIENYSKNNNSSPSYSLYNIENPLLKFKKKQGDSPKVLMVTSTESKSGKTFIMAGLAGVLMEKGLNVGVLKLGSNIKDILPALYLTKNNMENYSLIKNENEEELDNVFGWNTIEEVIHKINKSNYDIVLIEGEKGIFDNLTNFNFYSTVEIALSSNIPILLISSAKYGLDYAISDSLEHEKILYSLGINLEALILNNIEEDDFNNYDNLISPLKKQFDNMDNIFKIPYINSTYGLDENKTPSDYENRYDVYSPLAFNVIKDNVDFLKILSLAKEISFNKFYSLEELEFLNKFLS